MKETILIHTKRLVEGLSSSERKSFRRYVSLKEKKDEKYVLLFNAFGRKKVLSENDLINVLSCKNQRNLYSICKYLQSLIFQAIAFEKSGGVSELESARVAVQKGFIKQGHSILKNSLYACEKSGDWRYFITLFREMNRIEKIYLLAKDTDSFELKQRFRELLVEEQKQIQFESAYFSLRDVLKNSQASKEFILNRFENLFDTAWNSSSYPKTQFYALKFRVLWFRMKGNISEALRHQQELATLIEKTPDLFSWEDLLNARSLLTSFLVFEERIEDLRKELLRIGLMETNSPVREDLIEIIWLKKSVLGAASGRMPELEAMALRKVQSSRIVSKLGDQWKVILFYYTANIHFCRGEWFEAKEFTNKITSLAQPKWGYLSWALYMLKALIHLELGDYYLSKLNLDKIDSSQTDDPYIQSSIQCLEEIISSESSLEAFENGLNKIERTISLSQNQRNSHFTFDLRLWLKSKISGVSISDIWRNDDSIQSTKFKILG